MYISSIVCNYEAGKLKVRNAVHHKKITLQKKKNLQTQYFAVLHEHCHLLANLSGNLCLYGNCILQFILYSTKQNTVMKVTLCSFRYFSW